MSTLIMTLASLAAVAAGAIHEWGLGRGVAVTCAIWLLMPQQNRTL